MKINNPFLLKGYAGDRYFCDREKETKELLSAIHQSRNVTIISLRRMGKTGLIQHVFSKVDTKTTDLIYLDIMPTSNLQEFTALFGKAIFTTLEGPVSKSFQKIASLFKRLSPSFTLDALTGQPSLELSVKTEKESEATLDDIFDYLKKRKRKTIIAIDEFQQITNYPEKKTEAILRSHIQHLLHTGFIFSGSQKHVLGAMFGNASRPFYQSTQFMYIDRIDKDKYKSFIKNLMNKSGKKITSDTLDEILLITKNHTFYVQHLCHKLFELQDKTIEHKHVIECMEDIMLENEPYYFNYKNLLTTQQWNLLRAIAMEGEVTKLNKREFLSKYHLSASSVQRSIKALLERELVIDENGSYRTYDVFLGYWIKRKF